MVHGHGSEPAHRTSIIYRVPWDEEFLDLMMDGALAPMDAELTPSTVWTPASSLGHASRHNFFHLLLLFPPLPIEERLPACLPGDTREGASPAPL